MSLATKITTEDDASAFVKELGGRVSPHRVAAEVAPRCTRLVQRNFRSLGQNKRGWPTSHFYGRAAESTTWQEGFGFVVISVNQIGVRQRLMGGEIRPVNGKALTIPARPEAYGKRASEFGDLQFKFVLDAELGVMRPALVEKQGTERKVGGKTVSQATGLVALFWLVRSVKQDPDPRVLPSDADFEAAFDASVEALLRS